MHFPLTCSHETNLNCQVKLSIWPSVYPSVPVKSVQKRGGTLELKHFQNMFVFPRIYIKHKSSCITLVSIYPNFAGTTVFPCARGHMIGGSSGVQALTTDHEILSVLMSLYWGWAWVIMLHSHTVRHCLHSTVRLCTLAVHSHSWSGSVQTGDSAHRPTSRNC